MFVDNRADLDGGALYVNLGSNPLFNACAFEGNMAGYAGGAARVLSSSPAFVSCAWRWNSAPYGGAVQNYESTGPLYANCLFHGNTATMMGGAIQNNNSAPFLVNCTIAMNWSPEGGGVHGWLPSAALIANSVIWGNSDNTGSGEAAQVTIDTASLSYSCVQNWSGLGGGLGMTAADPLFVDPDGPDNIPGTDDDNLRLRHGSPCIDAGDNTILPPDITDLDADGDTAEAIALDIEGYWRVMDLLAAPDIGMGTPPLVDMGAYEYGPQSVAPADFDADGDVDLTDFGTFQVCFNGPNRSPASTACKPVDMDYDGDVDLGDFSAFQACFNGPNRPPACNH